VETYFYETRLGHGLAHDPFKAILAPRPIGWVSTVDVNGLVNLAPYSFFNGFNSNPPIVGFSSEGRKDSVSNAEATGEFVCNMVTRDLAELMNATSANVSHDINEMALVGLDPATSRLVKPPRVARAAAAFECKVVQILPLHDLAGDALDSFLVLGQVVGVHINPAFLIEGRFDTAAARPIARCGYRGDYAEVTGLFEMIRPS
jgi:flavin reductase (DIM6/NTAB) family NADH-FMN oxidoreductase RutF